jgi:hypothetical protein
MRTANLALKFLLELVAFAALIFIGARLASGVWAVVLAVLLPVIAIAVWGRWNAPRSAHRLPARYRVPLELLIMGGAGVGLVLVGAPVWGIADLALIALNAFGLTVFHQWES